MPRGKYDRKESRIKRLSAELEESRNKLKQVKEELERRSIEAKSLRQTSPALVNPKTPVDKFAIMRDNLEVLSGVRKTLIETPGVSPQVMQHLDYEISVHVSMLANLRFSTFRAELEQQFEARTPQAVPLQVPQAAREEHVNQ